MEVKKILDKIKPAKEEKKDYFFALQIDSGIVKSVVWEIKEDQVRVLAIGKTLKYSEDSEILEAIDASLTSTIEKFTPQSASEEPSKVIFGLPVSWIEDENIAADKLALLKKISQKLELSPVGFVVTAEAMVHHLKALEGVPPTAILVGLNEERVLVSLINLGKIMATKSIRRSGDLGADLTEGFSRFEQSGPFPSRILLYNHEDNLEETKQELVNYSWQEGINFLHLPRVEVLAADFDIKAVALAGGKEVAKAEGITVKTATELQPAEKELTSVSESAAESEPKIEGQPEPEVQENKMGFVQDQDIGQQETTQLPNSMEKPVKTKKKLSLPKLPKIKLRLPNFRLRKTPLVLSIIGFVLLAIIGGLISAWWYLPKAAVVLFIEPQVLSKDFTVNLDPDLKTVDKENLVLPATLVEKDFEAKKTVATTGTALTGEAAKGEVVIFNGTSQVKTFTAETIITSNSGVEFTLDDEVSIASQSGTAANPTPGQVQVKVTAAEIGTEANLAADSEFVVANYAKSDYVAKNESAFSGGTSREVQVVSKKDQENLVKDLTAELENQALEGLRSLVALDKKLIEESVDREVMSKKFNKEIDEEADELTLNLKLNFSALSFSEEEFRSLIDDEIKKAVPDGFEYRADQSETDFELEKINKQGVASFLAHFEANLLPQLDLESIKNNLTGKHPTMGEAYLNSLPHIDSFEARISPNLPNKLMVFPRVAKNINIEVEVK